VFQGESHELLWHTSCTSWPRSHGTSEDLIPAREAAHGSGPGKRLARAFHLINVVVVAVAFAWLCSAASYVFFPLSTFPGASWSPASAVDAKNLPRLPLCRHGMGISFYCTRALEYKPQKGEELRSAWVFVCGIRFRLCVKFTLTWAN